jgi:hypothetical protein
MSKNEETKISAKSEKTEADMLWEQIKKTPISLFGLSPKSLEEMSVRLNVAPDKVHLSLRAPGAAIAAIEDALNVRRDASGAESRVDSFEVETSQNGMLIVGRKKSK